ncbi:MAG TPA: hypothetical protein PLR57_07160, partial [Clostridia bacterium]|nr:hypothetical protein [Clostridia bacterium]
MKRICILSVILSALSIGSLSAQNLAISIGIRETGGSGPAFANGGETIKITVTPAAGYKLKPNSLTVKTVEGSVEATVPVNVDANGEYTYKLPVPVGGDTNPMNVVITGTFITDPSYTGTTSTNQQKKSFSLGIGIAVAVTLHSNYAYIKNGTISAGSLELTATSGSESSQLVFAADSKAGYAQGDFGLAGAVTVHVASAKTKAIVGDKPSITLTEGGTLKIASASYETVTTNAVATSSGTASRLGVGAGISVGVFGADVFAKVADGASIKVLNSGSIKSAEITANHASTETLKSQAGSQGGISITPVLSLLISGARTEATLGTSNQLLSASEDITLTAKNSTTRELGANAAAAGGKVGIGASFTISVLNDSTTAAVQRSARARNVRVSATGHSSLKSTSRAGSQGASSQNSSSGTTTTSSTTDGTADSSSGEEGGESDKQADKSLGGGAKLAGASGSSN